MGISAFRKAYLASDEAHVATFESCDARRLRYAMYWSFFENASYDRVHNWTTALKHQYGLSKYIRGLYNPSYRLATFYASHLWGGSLSPLAAVEGAIPIETDNEPLRDAIATLWQASNWGSQKDVIALRGAVEGDVVLRVADDVVKGRVYLERVPPGIISTLETDVFGNVKGYTIEEDVADPQGRSRTVKYRLDVSRDGDLVVYETFLNGIPYGWNGQPAQWEEPYTFVPLVLIKHFDVGLEWGWSELHPSRGLIMELDDLASLVSDQIRKSVNPLYLMKGMKPGTLTVTGGTADDRGTADTRPQPGREEIKALWNVPTDASAEPLIGDLKLGDALKHIEGLLQKLEGDYPELRVDMHATSGTSGRALRIARQQVEAKVLQRRAGYDAALVKAQQMAVAIGGFRGYEGYEGFGLDSYGKGDLEHTIPQHEVFTADPQDEIEIDQAFWEAAKTATDAGFPLAAYLKRAGWTDEDIAEASPVDTGDKEI